MVINVKPKDITVRKKYKGKKVYLDLGGIQAEIPTEKAREIAYAIESKAMDRRKTVESVSEHNVGARKVRNEQTIRLTLGRRNIEMSLHMALMLYHKLGELIARYKIENGNDN